MRWRRALVRLSSAFVLTLTSACIGASDLLTAGVTEAASPEQSPAFIGPTDSWIEVDLTRQMVVLHEAGSVIAEYPASSGVASHPTPPGLYRVQMMEKGPIENVPGVFVSDMLMFHLGKGIGIHSRRMDADGNLLDATLGQPSSGGCVRVGESARVFEFAQLGMRIWIH
jgi:lipoprotein-anchoring transpeptidase ErfK/SrfK